MKADQLSTGGGPALAGFASGLAASWVLALGYTPWGFLMGALAVQEGLSTLESVLMSAWVYAGTAQIAALELWARPPPIASIIAAVGLVNARHLAMGLTMRPVLGGLPPWSGVGNRRLREA